MKRLAFVGMLPVAALILAAFVPFFNAEACTRMFWNTNGKAMLVGRNMDLSPGRSANLLCLSQRNE